MSSQTMAKLIKIFLPLISGICTIAAAVSAFRSNGIAVTALTAFTGFLSIWTAVSPCLNTLSVYRIVEEGMRYVRFTLTGEFGSFELLARYQHALRSFRMTSRTLNSTELNPIPSAPAAESRSMALSLPPFFTYDYKDVHDHDAERVESATTSLQVLVEQATRRGSHKASPAGRNFLNYGEGRLNLNVIDLKQLKAVLTARIAEGCISVTRPKTPVLDSLLQNFDWRTHTTSESYSSPSGTPRTQAAQNSLTGKLFQDQDASGVSDSQQSANLGNERGKGWFNCRW
ncbi:hypothetical protein WG66_001634 [Moniliophthora roreri]|nr:hypothetical protein WG66_001634 [Moniliophthora roreri]